MKTQRIALVLTLFNLALMTFLLAPKSPADAQSVPSVLRGRALEIVDAQNRVRASITVEPPVTMNGQHYPETVLVRLTDPKNGPVVKLSASEDGSALGLSDDVDGGVQLLSTKRKGNYVKVVNREGREQVIKP